MTAIECIDLALGYGAHTAISGVNLAIDSNDFVIIGGPNGSGKSTLLKGISRLLTPLSGRLHRHDTVFGYVPQAIHANLSLPMTAAELVQLGAAARRPWWCLLGGTGKKELSDILNSVHAGELSERVFSSLSTGQQQRVLMARALAMTPDCLLLDEPTAGVDQKTRQHLATLLAALHLSRSLCILLVSHEVQAFLPYATRFLWVEDGKVHEIKPDDFSQRAQTIRPEMHA